MTSVVEIGLLEGKAEPGNVVERTLHRRDRIPEIGAQRILSELDPAFPHSGEIPAGVALLLAQSGGESATECLWSIREFEQGESHQLGRKQFVIGEKVEEDPPVFLVDEAWSARQGGPGVVASGETQDLGPGRGEALPGGAPFPRSGLDFHFQQRQGTQFPGQIGREKHPTGEIGRSLPGTFGGDFVIFRGKSRVFPSKAGP